MDRDAQGQQKKKDTVNGRKVRNLCRFISESDIIRSRHFLSYNPVNCFSCFMWQRWALPVLYSLSSHIMSVVKNLIAVKHGVLSAECSATVGSWSRCATCMVEAPLIRPRLVSQFFPSALEWIRTICDVFCCLLFYSPFASLVLVDSQESLVFSCQWYRSPIQPRYFVFVH